MIWRALLTTPTNQTMGTKNPSITPRKNITASIIFEITSNTFKKLRKIYK